MLNIGVLFVAIMAGSTAWAAESSTATMATSPEAGTGQLPGESAGMAKAARRNFEHSNGLWTGRFWQDGANRSEQVWFLLDQGVWTQERASPRRSQQQSGRWTLGLGEDDKRFVEVSSQNLWVLSYQVHRLQIALDIAAGMFENSLSFRDLEAQLPRTGGADIESLSLRGRDEEAQGRLELTDTLRLAPSLSARLGGALQSDRRRRSRQYDEVNQLTSSTLGLEGRYARWGWDLRTDISRFTSKNLQNGMQLLLQDSAPPVASLDQSLRVSSAVIRTSFLPRFEVGLGYERSDSLLLGRLQQSREGPVLSIERKDDGRWSARSRLAWLENPAARNERTTEREFNLNLRLSGQSQLTLSSIQARRLLANFQVLVLNLGQVRVAQDDSRESAAGFISQWGRHRFSLQASETELAFEGLTLASRRIFASWDYQLTRRTVWTQSAEYADSRSDGESVEQFSRQTTGLAGGWRYLWSGGPLALDTRYFWGASWNYDMVQLTRANEPLQRLSLLLSIGTL